MKIDIKNKENLMDVKFIDLENCIDCGSKKPEKYYLKKSDIKNLIKFLGGRQRDLANRIEISDRAVAKWLKSDKKKIIIKRKYATKLLPYILDYKFQCRKYLISGSMTIRSG